MQVKSTGLLLVTIIVLGVTIPSSYSQSNGYDLGGSIIDNPNAPVASGITVTVDRTATATLDFNAAITDRDTNFSGFTVTFRTTGEGVTGPGDILEQGTFSAITGTGTTRTVTTESVMFEVNDGAILGTYVFPYSVTDGTNTDSADVSITIVDTRPVVNPITIAATNAFSIYEIDFYGNVTDVDTADVDLNITITYGSDADRAFFPINAEHATVDATNANLYTITTHPTILERAMTPSADATITIPYTVTDLDGLFRSSDIIINYVSGDITDPPSINVDDTPFEHIFSATRLTFTKIFTADEFEELINSLDNRIRDADAADATVRITNSTGTTHPTSSSPTDSVATFETNSDGLKVLRYSPAITTDQVYPLTDIFEYEVTALGRTGTGLFSFTVVLATCEINYSTTSLNFGSLHGELIRSPESSITMTNDGNIPADTSFVPDHWLEIGATDSLNPVMFANVTGYSFESSPLNVPSKFPMMFNVTNPIPDAIPVSGDQSIYMQVFPVLERPDFRGAVKQDIVSTLFCN